MLPVDAHQGLVGLLGVADLLGDAVLPPQLLDLAVALPAQMQGVPPPEHGRTHTHTHIKDKKTTADS